jgi:hypothetical protein
MHQAPSTATSGSTPGASAMTGTGGYPGAGNSGSSSGASNPGATTSGKTGSGTEAGR